MQETSEADYQCLDDSEFLAERARVRERLERLPKRSVDRAALAALYVGMTAKFDRRARAAWANASQTEGCRQ